MHQLLPAGWSKSLVEIPLHLRGKDIRRAIAQFAHQARQLAHRHRIDHVPASDPIIGQFGQAMLHLVGSVPLVRLFAGQNQIRTGVGQPCVGGGAWVMDDLTSISISISISRGSQPSHGNKNPNKKEERMIIVKGEGEH